MGDGADDAFDRAFDNWLDDLDRCGDEDCDIFDLFFGPRRVVAGPDEWVTLDRKVLKIKSIKPRHLANILNFIARKKANKKVGGARMIRLRSQAVKLGLVRDKDGRYHYAPGLVDARDDFSTVP